MYQVMSRTPSLSEPTVDSIVSHLYSGARTRAMARTSSEGTDGKVDVGGVARGAGVSSLGSDGLATRADDNRVTAVGAGVSAGRKSDDVVGVGVDGAARASVAALVVEG